MLERVYGFRAIFVSARTIKRHHHQEELWEAARDEEMKIPWRAANEWPPVPEEQYQEDSGGEDWMELDWTRQLKSS